MKQSFSYRVYGNLGADNKIRMYGVFESPSFNNVVLIYAELDDYVQNGRICTKVQNVLKDFCESFFKTSKEHHIMLDVSNSEEGLENFSNPECINQVIQEIKENKSLDVWEENCKNFFDVCLREKARLMKFDA
jgi:hypothetical protein